VKLHCARDGSGILLRPSASEAVKDKAYSPLVAPKKNPKAKLPDSFLSILNCYFLYITFFTALITSLALGNHSLRSVGEYGAGVSAVVILWMGASRKSKARS